MKEELKILIEKLKDRGYEIVRAESYDWYGNYLHDEVFCIELKNKKIKNIKKLSPIFRIDNSDKSFKNYDILIKWIEKVI